MPAANKDSLVRLLAMMQMIPIYPRWVSAKSLHAGLSDQGYTVTKRTVERDLNRFSTVLGLVAVDSPEGYKWSYASDNQTAFLPDLSAPEALSLKMVQKHLTHHLPPFLFANMQAIFSKADKTLNKKAPFVQWVHKVAVIPPGIPIRPHISEPDTLAVLYRGLMENRKVRVHYGRNVRSHVISLLGLIVRDNKLVFVCFYEGFTDTRMILAHRVKSAELTELTHEHKIDISQYATSGQPGSALSNDDIVLNIQAKGYIRKLLLESTIGKRQSVTTLDDTWSNVSVTLPHTRELEHWLKAHIEDIKIISPTDLKERVLAHLQAGISQNG